jgi:hypothetical protein
MNGREPGAGVGFNPRTTIAHLDRVSLTYDKRLALDAVSLDLPVGRMVGLIAPPGPPCRITQGLPFGLPHSS